MRTVRYSISEQDAGRRVDDFLIRGHGISRRVITILKKLPDGLLCNGIHIRTIDLLSPGDLLELNLPEPSKRIPPCDLVVPVLYEDDDVLVYNKPAGMPVHQSGGHIHGTLDGVYAAHMLQTTGSTASLRAINRLDKDTTGTVVVAKNQLAAGVLWKAVDKRYYAVVLGVPVPNEGTVDRPIAQELPMEQRRIVDPDGQRAITHYSVLAAGNGASLVEFRLETGRTHQIRVHMADLGYPLVGDLLYSSASEQIGRQALHCGRVSFLQPVTGQPLEIFAPWPEDFLKLLDHYNISVKL
ncbi:MAG: RluA family pseudouridine synthase [Angelakisella sp.]